MSASYAIERTGPGRARLAGSIDVENAADAYEEGLLLGGDGHRLELDVSDLASADNVTLAVLLALAGRARKQGGDIRFSGISAKLRALARLGDVEFLLEAASAPPH